MAIVRKISIELLNLTEGTKGRVHSVFKNACNIEVQDELITILGPSRTIGPRAMLLAREGFSDFLPYDIKPYSDVYLGSCEAEIKNALVIAIPENTEVWSPVINFKYEDFSENMFFENLKALENILSIKGKFYAIGWVWNCMAEEYPELNLAIFNDKDSLKADFIEVRFLNFIKSILEGSHKEIAEAAYEIAGFGLGLTPSADDFLTGFMTGCVYMSKIYCRDSTKIEIMNLGIYKTAGKRTTRISEGMLKAASEGKTGEAVMNMMNALLNQKYFRSFENSFSSLLNFGETSGTDTALGIYLACKLWTNPKYRRRWVNNEVQ